MKYTVLITLAMAAMITSGCASGYTSSKSYETTELIPRNAKVGLIGATGNGNQDVVLAKILGVDFQKRIGSNIVVLSAGDTQTSVDYVITFAGGVFQCPSLGSNSGDVAIGAITAVLLPISIMPMKLTSTNTVITVVNTKNNKQIGKGVYWRAGTGMIVSCASMMEKTAEYWEEKLFVSKIM